MILNFGIAERLRTLRYPIFTGGVVDEKRLVALLASIARAAQKIRM